MSNLLTHRNDQKINSFFWIDLLVYQYKALKFSYSKGN